MIRFRPHHFLCTLAFKGEGYSPSFVANYKNIVQKIESDPEGKDSQIEVVRESDSICTPCPHRRGLGCETNEKINQLDDAHAEILKLKEGDQLSWGDAMEKIRNQMSLEQFHQACAPCSWKALGVCETALRKLIEKTPEHSSKKGSLLALIAFLVLSTPLGAAPPAPSTLVPFPAPVELDLVWLGKLSKSADLLADGQVKQADQLLKSVETQKKGKRKFTEQTRALFQDDLGVIKSLVQFETALQRQTPLKDEFLNTVLRAQVLYPSSVLLPPTSLSIARYHLHQAQFLKSPKERVEAFTRALELEDFPHPKIPLSDSALKTFAADCKAIPEKSSNRLSQTCKHWVLRLLKGFGASSPEGRALTQTFPSLPNPVAGTGSFGKSTKTYKSPDKDQVAFDDAVTLIAEKKPDQALESFEAFLKEFPQSSHRNRARFWKSRLLDQKTSSHAPVLAKAERELIWSDSPFSFHALLAAKVGEEVQWSLLPAPPQPKAEGSLSLEVPLYPSPSESRHAFKIEALLALKVPSAFWLDAEIRAFRSKSTLQQDTLERWLAGTHKAGLAPLTLSLVTELIQRTALQPEARSAWIPWIFPKPEKLWSSVQKIAPEYELDPLLVLSLIKQESAFDSHAASHVGAWGLMQLMPFTALEVNPEITRMQLLSPESNMKTGCAYLQKLLKRYQGSVVLSLAAYNAGPNAVNRWVKEGKLKNGELLFAEQIPYKETRDYVFSILRNYAWYQHLARKDAKIQFPLNEAPVADSPQENGDSSS